MVGESQEAVGAGVGSASGGTNKMPTLEEYGTNLTRQAEEGKLDPVVVRLLPGGVWVLLCLTAHQLHASA